MATPIQWLNNFHVNTGAAAAGGQSDPQIIGLANGNFLVAWEEFSNGSIGTDPGTDLIGKIYNAQGGLVRNAFQINSFRSADDEEDFDIAPTNDGGFVIVYVDDDNGASPSESIIYERYDENGVSRVDEGSAAFAIGTGILSNPQVAVDQTDNSFIITFNERSGGDEDINARVVNSAGVLSSEFSAAQNSTDFDRLGDTAVLTNGNFVTVYEEDDAGTTGIEFALRTPAGAPVGPVPNVDDGTDPQVASLAGGGFVVTYTEGNDILARVFNNNGSAVGPNPITVASGLNNQNESEVVALPDGDFVVVWDDDTLLQIRARRFNPDGSSDGGTFVVNDTVNVTFPNIGVTGDGRILFTWQNVFGPNDNIFASIWDPRSGTIDPDDYNVITENFVSSDVVTAGRPGGSTVLAGAEGDTVLGQGGNDTIFSSSDGSFFGGGGNDTIHAGPNTSPSDFEFLNGGPGNDTLITTSFSGDYTINLITGETDYPGAPLVPVESFINFENVTTGVGDDSVTGTAGANVINTLGGNDTIIGGGGNDTLNGGNGSDSILGGAGFDLINGGSSSDTMNGGNGDDTVNGGNGRDLANLGNGNDTYSDTAQNDANGQDTVNGGAGNDTINGGGGNDELNGEDGNDLIIGGNGNDVITGGANFDTLNAGNGNDTVNGGNGRDLANLGNGNDNYSDTAQNDINGRDTVNGGDGDDVINGGGGNDLLNGQGDNDLIFGVNGFDMLNGGNGSDTLNGGNGNDTLNGGNGNDTLNGGNNNDVLNGGNNNDRLIGGSGDDILNGGNGNDIMNGNAGNDVFIFANGFGNDTIEGFEENNNLEDIDLSAVASIVNFADLTANHMGQVGTDVVINAGGGNIITITNVDIADMNFGDFLF